ncbi:MAG: heterodisulfide reductase-related iron-sulfur binding cluster, partial [Promicromonosporaceae bacterium]|nr:heterodisulfide reductase-related iron-sulfur binding cluster [Promicromonosporaceae bacterium]
PRWTRLLGRLGRPVVAVVNAVLSVRPIARLVLRLGGMDPRRKMMRFAPQPFRTWYRKQGMPVVQPAETTTGLRSFDRRNHQKPRVVLWTDSFSDGLATEVPKAALKVLTAAGYDVIVPDEVACCGLTWISTGQLDGAKRQLARLLNTLAPYAVNGIPIMGLEPSCTGVLRSDLLDLFPDDPRAAAIAGATYTLAELLTDPETSTGWQLPDLSGLKAVVQPHCHHHSVMGFAKDEALLRAAGAQIEVLAGCCGLAGNFGMQKGHYEISVAVAENALLPALRAADADTEFLADGFSCRTQATHLANIEGKALAQILATHLPA